MEPGELIERLRERAGTFECATYKALQAGQADRHQQQSAAAGIVVASVDKHKAADALEAALLRISLLEGALQRIGKAEGFVTRGSEERMCRTEQTRDIARSVLSSSSLGERNQ